MKSLPAAPCLITLALAFVCSGTVLAEEGAPDSTQLRYTKWTPDFQVPDPVAISIDEQGRAYVTQTQRRKAQDLDIRSNRDWIVNDVGFQSVEEKRAFFLDRLAPANSADNTQRVKDHNGDGSHDYRDLMQLSERIYLIEDTGGSGTADSMRIWAEDFKTEVTGIAAGVLYHQGDVYAAVAPDVWKLRDSDGDGSPDQREVIATGFGLHIAYGGHDMHGLTVGPDGKIYWSIGDKGISATSREGRKFHYPNQGGVMRCNPDGSDFEVFAHGLRNVQELAFDDYGNLFGVDNDSDGPGEKERFVYIVRDMDAGWRCNYQYRGKGDYNPWHDEKIWHTCHEGQPASIVPPIRLYVNGPAGFTRDPGTALSPDYRGYFFLTSAPNGQQYAFQAKARGASFEMINEHQIGDGHPIVGINFGPDGALYGVDWGGGYPLNEQGAVWKIDVPEFADSDARRDTSEKLRADFSQYGIDRLVDLLAHPDQRVRLKAQFQLAALDDPLIPTSVALDGAQAELARVHALWTLVQTKRFSEALNQLADEPNSELRAQFAKLAGEAGDQDGIYTESMIRLVADPSERVRFFAAIALGQNRNAAATKAILAAATELGQHQTYLRHAYVTGLAGCAGAEDLAALANADSEAHRLCALLALRRQGSAEVSRFLDDDIAWIATEAARAIHDDFSITAAMPQLAATLDRKRIDDRDERYLRRALNAALRIGSPEQAQRVARFASQTQQTAMAFEALDLLSEWIAPAPFDRVDGRVREFAARDPKAIGEAVAPSLSQWLTHPDSKIQAAGLRVASALELKVPTSDLISVLEREKNPADLRIEALNTLHAQRSDELADAIDVAMASQSVPLRIRGGQLLARNNPDRARDRLSFTAVGSDAPIAERQAAFASLALSGRGESILAGWLQSVIDGKVPAALQLDILMAVESRATDPEKETDSYVMQLNETLKAYREKFPDNPTDPAAFRICLEGGDADRGRTIFNTHIAAQCTACHKSADGKGSTVGPNLKSIGAKQPPEYILESLIHPPAVITKGYGMISLTLKNGDSVAGSLRKESDTELELRDAEGKTTKVAVADIATRSPVISTMPPMGVILQKHEIRDLVAFLKTLRAE